MITSIKEYNPVIEKKTSSFFYQVVHTIITKGGILIIGVLTGIVTARILKPEGKGLLAMFQVLPAMIITFGELGIRQSTAYLTGRKMYSEEDIQGSMMLLFFITGSISLCIIFLGYWSLGLLKYGFLMSFVFALMAPIALFQRYSGGLLLGRKLIEKMNYVNIIRSVGSFIFIILFVLLLNWEVLGAGFGLLVAQTFAAVLILYWISKYASLKPIIKFPIFKIMIQKGLLFALSLFVITLNYRADIIMLGKMQNASSVGIYNVGVNICELLKQIPLSVGVVLFSHSTNWDQNELREVLTKTATISRIILLLSIICSLIFASVVWWLIPLFYGEPFQESSRVVWYLLPGITRVPTFDFLT